MCDLILTEEDICNKLCNSKSDKSPGLDLIPGYTYIPIISSASEVTTLWCYTNLFIIIIIIISYIQQKSAIGYYHPSGSWQK